MGLRKFDLDIYHVRAPQMADQVSPMLNFDPLCNSRNNLITVHVITSTCVLFLISILLFSILDTCSKQIDFQVILTIQSSVHSDCLHSIKSFQLSVSIAFNLIKSVKFSHTEVLTWIV